MFFFQKENVEGEFDVTEKVKRKKKVTIFNQEDFFKDTFFEGESYLCIKTNVV